MNKTELAASGQGSAQGATESAAQLAAAVAHAEPASGGSYTRNLATGDLVKNESSEVKPAQE
jgi:hypothetical protein